MAGLGLAALTVPRWLAAQTGTTIKPNIIFKGDNVTDPKYD